MDKVLNILAILFLLGMITILFIYAWQVMIIMIPLTMLITWSINRISDMI